MVLWFFLLKFYPGEAMFFPLAPEFQFRFYRSAIKKPLMAAALLRNRAEPEGPIHRETSSLIKGLSGIKPVLSGTHRESAGSNGSRATASLFLKQRSAAGR